jgi:hypothetical protein
MEILIEKKQFLMDNFYSFWCTLDKCTIKLYILTLNKKVEIEFTRRNCQDPMHHFRRDFDSPHQSVVELLPLSSAWVQSCHC